jgi:NAD dependent epimerase/dehydratase family enzyme
MILSGQRAVPARANQLGFRFTYPTLSLALDAVLHHRR